MKEIQAFRVLQDYLGVIARRKFLSASKKTTPEQGRIISWPEAVQWLLGSFATNDAIHNAMLQLRDVKQLPSEDGKKS